MESSIAEFLKRYVACERIPTNPFCLSRQSRGDDKEMTKTHLNEVRRRANQSVQHEGLIHRAKRLARIATA